MERIWHQVGDGRMRLACLLAAVVLLAAGCIAIPIPVSYYTEGSRRNLTPASTNLLQVGVTTREQVLLTLGEPDYVSKDERRFGHVWSKVKTVWLVGTVGGGGGQFEMERTYLLETTFDASNRVAQVRFLKEWGPFGLEEDEQTPKPGP